METSRYQLSLLQHLSHLSSLIVAMTREPDNVAFMYAKEFIKLWKSLFSFKRRRAVLQILASCPLLMMHVTHQILDKLCPHPSRSLTCAVRYAKLSHLMEAFFCVLPPRKEQYSNSLLKPKNFVDNMNDGSGLTYSPTDVEELAFLLYHLVESYLTVANGE